MLLRRQHPEPATCPPRWTQCTLPTSSPPPLSRTEDFCQHSKYPVRTDGTWHRREEAVLGEYNSIILLLSYFRTRRCIARVTVHDLPEHMRAGVHVHPMSLHGLDLLAP